MMKDASFINYVADRPGHDIRYALDCSKLRTLGWEPRFDFKQMLGHTAAWYQQNRWWWEPLKNTSGKRTS